MRCRLQPVSNLQQLLGFDVCVSLQVGLQVGPLVETPLTDGTPVRGLLVVENLVDGKRAGLTEAFTTVRALERFLFGMDVAVVPEIVSIERAWTASQLPT